MVPIVLAESVPAGGGTTMPPPGLPLSLPKTLGTCRRTSILAAVAIDMDRRDDQQRWTIRASLVRFRQGDVVKEVLHFAAVVEHEELTKGARIDQRNRQRELLRGVLLNDDSALDNRGIFAR